MFAVFCMLYVFFWVIPRLLNFICRRFGTLCSIFLGTHRGPRPLCGSLLLHYLLCNRTYPYSVTLLAIGSGYFRVKPSPVWIPQQFSNIVIPQLPAYEDGTKCSETWAYEIQTPGNYPEENIQVACLFKS
jgi:hypothetical protein